MRACWQRPGWNWSGATSYRSTCTSWQRGGPSDRGRPVRRGRECAADLRAIASQFGGHAAAAGEHLLTQGETSVGLGFLIDGQAAVRINGREHTRLARGEIFGEISALLGEPISGDLVALGPVRYVLLEAERLRQFLTSHPEVCFRLLQGESRRLRNPTRWYASQPMRAHDARWSPSSWHGLPVVQQPEWPNEAALEHTLAELRV